MPAIFLRRLFVCAALFTSATAVAAAATLPAATPLVRGLVSDAVTVPLTADRPGALATSRDQGAVSGNALLPHIRLALKRSPDRQAALDELTREQYMRGTANYHRWLKPADLRAYGPAQADIDKVAAWLASHRLTVNSVSPSGMSIDFGGSVANVNAAFHTQLHNVARAGVAHIANVAAPAIPTALSPVVLGVTLANYFPKPAMRRVTPALTVTDSSGSYYAVAPADFATIYNVKPLRGSFNEYHAPITGAGVTVAVVEQTMIKTGDWNRFRQVFGLSGFAGKLSQVQPGGCASPGMTGDEGEAALDAEWAGAVAPDANIIEASCATTAPLNFGVESALQNLVELGTPATIFSISYGGPELENGFAFVAGWNTLLQEGAAEGKAIFVSSGDSGSSSDEGGLDVNGLDVNGLADSAYNVSVGGTDFYDSALGQNATYWHTSNTKIGGSAISYNPEIPWNNSCASSILYTYLKLAGPLAFCNSSAGTSSFVQNDIGGTGGRSDYYSKPDWQLTSVLGMPNDGVRDQPDVSLFAANGIWGHFYVFCMSDANEGGAPCNYTTPTQVFGNAAGGTSFSSPAFAGVAALLQQSLAAYYGQTLLLGNPAPIFYQIAHAQFASPIGLNKCDSTLGNGISPVCVFNYVTKGDIDEPCVKGTLSCHTSSLSTAGIGALGSTVGGKFQYAYPAQTGYSLATGLGTVNVTNLLYNYDAVYP